MVIKFKNEAGDFITVNRGVIDRDTSISFKAKGIITYIIGKSNSWTPHIDEIATHAKDKRASIKSGISELKKAGYIRVRPLQDKKTGQWGWEWRACDHPIYRDENEKYEREKYERDSPKVDFPKVGKSTFGEAQKPKVEKQLSESFAGAVGDTAKPESRKTDFRKIDFDNNKDIKRNIYSNKDHKKQLQQLQKNIFSKKEKKEKPRKKNTIEELKIQKQQLLNGG